MAQVNINNIITDLNNKADIQLGNLNNTGKEVIANLGMPDPSKRIVLTPPTVKATQVVYQAPADGYVLYTARCAEALGQIALSEDNGLLVRTISPNVNQVIFAWLPIAKNKSFNVAFYGDLSTTNAINQLLFFYAHGSKHLAS